MAERQPRNHLDYLLTPVWEFAGHIADFFLYVPGVEENKNKQIAKLGSHGIRGARR